jgi:hypothetical protein
VPLPWLVTTLTMRTVPPMAIATPTTMAMTNLSWALLPPAEAAFCGVYDAMVNVTSADGPRRR